MKQIKIDISPRHPESFDAAKVVAMLYVALDIVGIDTYTPEHMAIETLDEVVEVPDCTYELCPWCGNEVVLLNEFKWQICGECGTHIKPCSICPRDAMDCNKCKLDKNTNTCYTHACHYNEGGMCMYKAWGDDGYQQDCEGLIKDMRWDIDED